MARVVCKTLLSISCIAYMLQHSQSADIPTPVQLGSAIIAAVEEDAEEAEEAERKRDEKVLNWTDFFQFLNSVNDIDSLERTLTDIDEGRGKFRKKHKLLKQLYPVLVGVLIAKSVIIPLLLKLLTAVSTSSFVMSKIALITTGFLALKWIFGSSEAKERTHLEIVQLPAAKTYPHNLVNAGNYGWDDLTWSGSSYVEAKTKQSQFPLQQSKYIPVSSSKGAFSGMNGGSYPSYLNMNYDNAYDGKPFL